GVRLVISDAQRGIVEAVRSQLLGAAWQRCRVHATRSALDLVPTFRRRGLRRQLPRRHGAAA
ncbi:MAG: transposase, partial [Candidatus Limnocylindrales bacterium]